MRLLPLLVLLALPAAVQAQWSYTTNNSAITITKYTGSGGAVTIPDTINGLPVTSIGDQAFWNCTNLTSVTIPNSVTTIGGGSFADNGVFQGCSSLTNVSIPNSVSSIAEFEFWDCTSLTSVTIPNSVTNVGSGAFYGCTNLVSVTIPNSVTSLAECVFFNCISLTNVTIPDSVISIEEDSFWHCTNLTTVTIGSSVTSIKFQAFWDCVNLTSVYFRGSPPGLEDDVFEGDSKATVYYSYSLGPFPWNSTFGGRPALLWGQQWQAPFFYTTIDGTNIIIGYSGLGGSVSIPDTINGLPVSGIGAGTFAGCTNLTSVTIGDNVTTIGGGAFALCVGLTNVTIPKSVSKIVDCAFENCTNLTSVYFQGNAPSLPGDVFYRDVITVVYYLPGTTGWGATLAGFPTLLWNPQPLAGGVTANQFGFTITGATNLAVVVEACTNLANPIWSPVGTNTLAGGASYFSDPQWTNYTARFYRLRSP